MKQAYSLWSIFGVAAVVIVVALIAFVKDQHPTTTSSPSPSPLLSPETSPSLSPSPSPSASLSPSPSPSSNLSHADQAAAAYQRKDYITAIAQYQLAIKETSSATIQADLWNKLGNSYRDNASASDAIMSYNQAIAKNAKLVSAYINLSNVYVSQNKRDMARSTLEAGLKANPNNSELERELSIVNLSGTGGDY